MWKQNYYYWININEEINKGLYIQKNQQYYVLNPFKNNIEIKIVDKKFGINYNKGVL